MTLDFTQTTLTVKVSLGDAKHIHAVCIALDGKEHDWEVFGNDVANTILYLVDCALDESIEEDANALGKGLLGRCERIGLVDGMVK